MPGPNQEAGPKPFECLICQARFLTERNRKYHIILVHENAGHFRCDRCDKSFHARDHLEKHERAHMGKRPFRCKICKKSLTTKYHLRNHHLNFHSKRKFRCEVCDKSFGTKENLRYHFRCHSNERFECNQCGLSYKHRKDLKLHQARHHSATKQETPGPRLLTGSEVKKADLKVVLSDCRNSSAGVAYNNLRTRGKTANYRDEQEDAEFDEENGGRSSGNCLKSSDHLQDGVNKTSEPDQTTIGNDVLDGEPNDRTENDRDISEVSHAMEEHVQNASPMIILSSDDEDEEEESQDGELAMETSTISNVTLKLVYDVEYRAPE